MTNRCKTRRLRGMSAVELMAIMTVGVVFGAMAFTLTISMSRRAQAVTFRSAALQQAEVALDRIEGQLDFMAPAAMGDIDYALERFGDNALRFWSSADFQGEHTLALCEIAFETQEPTPTESGAPRLVRRKLSSDGSGVVDTVILSSFDPGANVAFGFEVEGAPPEGALHTQAARPAQVRIAIVVRPADPQIAAAPVELARVWRTPRRLMP